MSDKYSFYSNCGCLQSESTAALKKFTKNSPQELQTNNHSYSQTCLQNLSNADSLKKMFISQESIYVVKLNTLRKRMIATLNQIQSLLGDRPQPDGVEDLKRRQQRATEFSSRFCRNYLYPLQREMNVIAKMWENQSLNRTHSAYFSLCQKVISTHQNAHSALQAYFHHMPCSVEKGVPDKLEELLQVVNNLCSVCSKLDMSEGDSDFNSKRVKQQCQQLLLQIKTEVIDEGESCIAGSHSCTQKDITPTPKKETMPHRFSMYSRNNLRKLYSNQNKRTCKVSITSKKRPIKLHCNKLTEKETNVPHCKQNNKHGKLTASKTLEKVKEDGSEIGEVCASDDVRTMMEFFLAEEIPAQCSGTSSKQVYSRKTTSSFLKELDKQTLPSMSTLKKLEDEIKNLKKQTKSLKEIGHPNYSVYIQALDTMSNQLSEIKLQKHTSDISSFPTKHMSLQKQIENERLDSGFPKNVKLICLSSEADPMLLSTTQNCTESAESIANKIRKMYTIPKEDNDLQHIILPDKERKKETQINGAIQMNEWKVQDIGKSNEVNNKKHSEFLPEFTETQSTCDTNGGIQHPNTPVTEYSTDRFLDHSKLTDIRTDEKLTISQHEISSALAYQRVFQDYMSSSSLYKESLRPWLMVARLANRLIDGILEEITLNDTGIQNITSGLLQLEFQ